jgi:hypothetical protein
MGAAVRCALFEDFLQETGTAEPLISISGR